MGKRSKRGRWAASIGHGQPMQLTYRMPRLSNPPTLSPVAKQWLLAVECSLRLGVPVAAETFRVSRAMIYRWRARYNQHKLETLKPRSIRMRRPRPRRPHATRKPATYQPQHPGDLLQTDTVQLSSGDGSQLRQFSAIDVVSRVAAVGVRSRATAGTAAAFLDDLLDRFPLRIRAIQVDGGSAFMAEFEEVCATNAFPVYVLPRRSPKLNGRVERFNRTSREEFWQCYDGDLAPHHARIALRAWEDEYNHLRSHQALQMQPPIAYLQSHMS
ncbi:hypothetical protein BH23CHL5_BH23CHL5_22670 [soil metagenome]